MNWARLCRDLFESSTGSFLPTDFERLTVDQALSILLPRNAFGGVARFSPEAAAAMGLVPLGKSRVEEIREQQAAEKAQAAEQANAAKRQRRRSKRRN